MIIKLTLTDSQVARLRELDRALAPGWENYTEQDLRIIAELALSAGMLAMEERWKTELKQNQLTAATKAV